MIVKLIEPNTKNWLLVAEELHDPASWSRMSPCHSVDSERFRFEETVRRLAVRLDVQLCRELLRRGVCTFEYGYDSDETDILNHAIEVADTFAVPLAIGDSLGPTHDREAG